MKPIMKVREVNSAKFLGIPKSFVARIKADYMACSIDDQGRLVYTPIKEVGGEKCRD
jgi:hypothetical protein